jgi:hypothetical protein
MGLTALLATQGFTIDIVSGENGFPAEDPTGAPWNNHHPDDIYYANTSPEFQAAMLVRILSCHLAFGVRKCNWYNFVHPADPTVSWSQFSTMGVHNCLVNANGGYLQRRDCWQQPAWFAFQKLAWLLDQVNGHVHSAWNQDGVTVLEFSRRGGRIEAPSGRQWSRAFLFWRDQKITFPPHRPTVMFMGGSFEYLMVVPTVVSTSTPYPPDANGYPRPTVGNGLQWQWSRTFSAVVNPSPSAVGPTLDFSLNAADPVTAPLPLCILTDSTFLTVF